MFSLRNIKITYKLFAIVALVLVGFVAVGISYLQVKSSNEEFEAALVELTDFVANIKSADAVLLRAQLVQKDFILTRNVDLLIPFETEMTDARERFAEAAANLPKGVDSNSFNELVRLSAQYHSNFYAMAEAQGAIGFDENSGEQGELNQAIRDAVENIKNVSNDKLNASILSMRQHEKDYLLSGDDKYITRMNAEQEKFLKLLNSTNINAAKKSTIATKISTYSDSFNSLVAVTRNSERVIADVNAQAEELTPVFKDLVATILGVEKNRHEQNLIDQKTNTQLFIGMLIGIAFLVTMAVVLVALGITGSLKTLRSAIQRVTDGDLEARAEMTSGDELGELGQAFDNLLDERVSTMLQAEQENERLNDSIINVLEATSQLSDRDLSVKVPVAEDVTGPVADSLNMMASETARVLKDIRDISEQVEQASNSVNSQGQRVTQMAANERKLVQATTEKLEAASKTMNQIAKLAQSCNEIAATASSSTAEALTSVNNTEEGMNDIRETISETEKRIKRLGERSQEITGVVEIINNIAERTHILALNASMQAAAAGDAGRGFAVVADEVQRLAESSRQSTAEIQALVSNIQTETAETMATMNKTITQVVDGTVLAQRSGEQMQATQKTTNDLATSVEKIAQHSLMQAKVSNTLREQAAEIVDSTEETSKELEEQSVHTARLVDFSKQLLASVNVFKLPA